MLQFITSADFKPSVVTEFQYISCCSLSFLLLSLPHLAHHFNTSHVVVYLGLHPHLFRPHISFQYISCCSLSPVYWQMVSESITISIHLMLQFIRDRKSQRSKANKISIHLMLQFINILFCVFYFCANFNTSHVVVYRTPAPIAVLAASISIHLMLQFIVSVCYVDVPINKFQYISCCSLSYAFFKYSSIFLHFNTSHVVVYQNGRSYGDESDRISIHLMLQFIRKENH